MNIESYINSVFSVSNEEDFERFALQAFDFQYKYIQVYRDYVNLLNRNRPQSLSEIPFLPIDFFKFHSIRSGLRAVETIFKSSGTTGQTRSVHAIEDVSLYKRSFVKSYEIFVGNPEEQVIIALLPNYVEQEFSSLVYMVTHLIELSGDNLSGFYLYDVEKLKQVYKVAINKGKQVILFGVTYALLDLVENGISFPGIKVIETGGMKGRRKEISKAALHQILKEKLKVESVYSEYGMCELLSQGYSADIKFHTPPWMKILVRDKNDPFSYVSDGKSGGINVIDLVNIYSCSFIQSQDLGRRNGDSFEVLGRMTNTEWRGCNLMLDENSF